MHVRGGESTCLSIMTLVKRFRDNTVISTRNELKPLIHRYLVLDSSVRFMNSATGTTDALPHYHITHTCNP